MVEIGSLPVVGATTMLALRGRATLNRFHGWGYGEGSQAAAHRLLAFGNLRAVTPPIGSAGDFDGTAHDAVVSVLCGRCCQHWGTLVPAGQGHCRSRRDGTGR